MKGAERKNGRLAVVHDYIENVDGGSRLCVMLGRHLGADLLYGFRKKDHPFFSPPYGPGNEIAMAPLATLPFIRQMYLAHMFLRNAHMLNRYEQVVFSGFYAPLAANRIGTAGTGRERLEEACRMVYYCHTPPRFCYDMREFYASRIPLWGRAIFASFLRWYQPQFELAVSRIPTLVTNSRHVKERIATYLDRDAVVVSPPCDTGLYENRPSQGYYVSMGRLDPLKRIDIVIEAFKRMPDRRLVVTSSGPEERALKELASGAHNITFAGALSDVDLRKVLAECIATVYIPQQEDFGMCAVESLAAGKPVIAASEGGLLEIVEDGVTGCFVPSMPTSEDVIEAVLRLDCNAAARLKDECELVARKYDITRFWDEMKAVLNV